MRTRIPSGDSEAGVYAVLYAALVLVMIGMGAVVVDIATLREDRRDNRAAADSAVLAGIQQLDPNGDTGINPEQACHAAWANLMTALSGLTKGDACDPFVGIDVATYCVTTPQPAMIRSNRDVGTRQVVVAWPVPRSASDGFLTADLAPGEISQPFAPGFDGPIDTSLDNGCDRFGVAVFEDQEFGLAGALGAGGTSTQVHSVARVDPTGGPPEEIAALNVLNPKDCLALVTTGGGKVFVGPVLKGGVFKGPGLIAIESDARGTCGGSGYAIAPTTGPGSLICASSIVLNATGTNCDALGFIRSHALDFGGNTVRAWDPNATNDPDPTKWNIRPKPTPEGGRQGWDGVTKLYGCESLTASLVGGSCLVSGRNHIEALVAALGSGTPTAYTAESPYPAPAPMGFTATPATVCANINNGDVVRLAPGNWFANCGINIKAGGSLIVEGGTLVVKNGIEIAAGGGPAGPGCFVVNFTTCTPTLAGQGTSAVTTVPAPTKDALVYLRGDSCPSSGCFSNAGVLVMPQTFVYSAASAAGIDVKGTALTLWTAPGAGPVDGDDRTTLERACLVTPAPPAVPKVDEDCLNSRFSRLAYWSEFASPKTKPNNFAGQGSLNVVGVFFTPRAYFDFSGGGVYTAAAAQFWADKLNLNGGAVLGLIPDARFSVETSTSTISLIR